MNSASLNPSSISRTSPRHALAVFSESTLRGLQFYDNCKWSITGQFVSFILNLWKVLNIQTPVKGKHKNGPLQDPLTHHDRRFQMLHRAAELLSSWEKSGRAGMTKETIPSYGHKFFEQYLIYRKTELKKIILILFSLGN